MGKYQFAGELSGTAMHNPRTYGEKSNGMIADVGGWRGMIRTRVYYSEIHKRDMFSVYLIPHWEDRGKETLLAEGILNHEIDDPYIVPAMFA